MDIVFLEQVKVQAKLGVPAWERLIPQTIILDIEIGYDLSKACKSDAISDTIDYGIVVDRIRNMLNSKSFQLVESLAEHICQLIFEEFNALSVKIKAAKPSILPDLKSLGVVINRKNSDYFIKK